MYKKPLRNSLKEHLLKNYFKDKNLGRWSIRFEALSQETCHKNRSE